MNPRQGSARLAVLAALCARIAHADPASVATGGRAGESYSDYERAIIREALSARRFRIEPRPEGKQIERIEIVALNVFDESDPVPDFFNVFHVTSRKHVIRRELLFREGQSYVPTLVDESARNLRQLRQLSLVLLVPVRGSRADSVRVLVITKDVWSLRVNSDFAVVDGKLSWLLLNPSEENLFGTHTSVGGLFVLKPDTYSLGAVFTNRRVAASRIQARVGANLILNRVSGDAEGSFGHFFYGQPLYSLGSQWAYGTAVAWRTEITRRYIGLDLRHYNAESPRVACAENPRCIPYVYDTERWLGESRITRSFGSSYKYDFSFGLEADRRLYRPPSLAGYDPSAVHAFVTSQLPVSDTRISPFFELHAYAARYLRVLDFETLGLQEDYRVGHDALWRVYPASKQVGSSRDMLGSLAAFSYTLPIADGLVRGIGASVIELADRGRHDASVELAARAVTPRLGFGRFVLDGVLLNRYRNYLNRRVVIGGDSRPRGYAPGAFLGKDLVAGTLEFRSRPVEFLSAQLGAALFYDAADTADGFAALRPKHSAGFGLRALFPQADRTVFRADWGFPLSPGYNSLPGSLFVTFQQAFSLPALSSPSVTASFVESGD